MSNTREFTSLGCRPFAWRPDLVIRWYEEEGDDKYVCEVECNGVVCSMISKYAGLSLSTILFVVFELHNEESVIMLNSHHRWVK